MTEHLEALRPLIMINTIKDCKNGHEPFVAHDMLIVTMSLSSSFEAWNPQKLDKFRNLLVLETYSSQLYELRS